MTANPRTPLVRRSLGAAFLAVGLIAAAFVLFGGCADKGPTGRTESVGLRIHVTFSPPLDGGVQAAAQGSAIARIRARAFEVLPDGDALRAEAETEIGPEDTRFRLELSVPPGGPYRVVVTALDGEGTALYEGSSLLESVAPGVDTEVTIVLVDVSLPAAPEGLVADALSPTSVRVRWTDRSDNETQYEVERRGAADPEFTQIGVLAGSFSGTVEYVDEGLPDRTVFTYRARARNLLGPSAYSNEDTTRTGVPAPGNLIADGIGANGVNLTWEYAFADPDLFHVERREGSGPFAERTTASGAERSTTDTITRGVLYTYRLRAEDLNRLSAYSAEDTVLIPENPPVCAVAFDETDSLRFGLVDLGATADRALLITNAGEGTLSGNAALDAGCTAFSIVQGAGSFALGANQSRRVVVRYTPLDEAGDACTLSLGTPCGSFSVTGTGKGNPVCSISPSSLDFGQVTVGQTASLDFTIENTGTGTLTGTVGENCTAYTITGGGGSFALGQGATRTVTVAFTPTSEGNLPCSITTGTVCAAVPATGLGVKTPVCNLSATSLDFGLVGTGVPVDRSFTVRNTGGGTLTGAPSFTCSDPRLSIVAGDGAFSLAAGASRTITVRLLADTEGEVNCAIDLGQDLCSDVTLTGSVQNLPNCQISVESLEFGDVTVGETATRSFTITNTGGGTVNGTVAESCNDFTILAGSGIFALGAGQSRQVDVQFAPGRSGAATCTILTGVTCGDVPAHGNGVDVVACSVTPPSLDFASVDVGKNRNLVFHIHNDGTGTLQGTATESCDEFLIVSGANFAIPAGDSAAVTVRFAPTAGGLASCSIALGTACGSIEATGTGTEFTACEVEPASIDFGTFVLIPGGPQFTDRTFTIRNTGTLPLSGSVSEACGSFSLPAGAGPYTLAPGATRDVTVRFQPTSINTFQCDVQTGTDCLPVACTAASALPGNCTVAPLALDFGIVGINNTNTLSFDIQNTGGAPISGNVQLGDCSSDFLLLSGGGAFTLDPQGLRTVQVRFRPTLLGAQDCEVLLGTTCASVSLTGFGATCLVTPSVVDFGVVGVEQTVSKSFTMQNFSSGPISGVLSESCSEFSITPSGSYTLQPGEQLNVTVDFDAFMYGDFQCEIQTGSACGTVTALASVPNCYINYETTSFGFYFTGSPAEFIDVVIENPGPGTLTGTVTKDLSCSSAFTLINGGAYSIPAGGQKTVTVRFFTTVDGNYSCDIDFGTACGIYQFTATAGTIGKPQK